MAPRTQAGKRRKVATVLREFKAGDLQSSSGQTVTTPKQAVAIALSEAGRSKPKATQKPVSRKRSRPSDVVVVQRS